MIISVPKLIMRRTKTEKINFNFYLWKDNELGF